MQGCKMIRWFFRFFKKDDIKANGIQFVWCLVGNIVEKHYFGEERQVKTGTKQFAPNAKMYCFPTQWGDGYENIKVIGRPRNSRKLITVVMRSKYIKNWRIQKVFHPYIVEIMKKNYGWDDSEKSREDILKMLEWLPERTEETKY